MVQERGKKVLHACQQGNREVTRPRAKITLSPRIDLDLSSTTDHPTMSQPNTPDLITQEQVPASISAAAHAYQIAMQQQSATPAAAIIPAPEAQAPDSTKDVVMTDGTLDRPAVGLCTSFL